MMLGSEIVARRRQKKVSPTVQGPNKGVKSGNLVISNLIPFTKLNNIFAFSLLLTTIVRLINSTQMGVPFLSIQGTTILLCLLITNKPAKKHFKKKCFSTLGINANVQTKQIKKEGLRNEAIKTVEMLDNSKEEMESKM